MSIIGAKLSADEPRVEEYRSTDSLEPVPLDGFASAEEVLEEIAHILATCLLVAVLAHRLVLAIGLVHPRAPIF
jgi:hypothetical protein